MFKFLNVCFVSRAKKLHKSYFSCTYFYVYLGISILLCLFLWVFPSDSKAGDIIYKAQSQDEDALVTAAAKLHMVFVGKNANLLGNSGGVISVFVFMEYVSKN